MIEMIRKL